MLALRQRRGSSILDQAQLSLTSKRPTTSASDRCPKKSTSLLGDTQDENNEQIPLSKDKMKKLEGQSHDIGKKLRQIWHGKVVSKQCEKYLTMDERQLAKRMKECVWPEVEPSPESRHMLPLVFSTIARGTFAIGLTAIEVLHCG